MNVNRCEQLVWLAEQDSVSQLVDHPSVELAEDLEIVRADDAAALAIHKPLRLALTEPRGTLSLEFQLMRPERDRALLWTSPEVEAVDYYQVVNKRLQNYEPHLRRMPGTYALGAWSKEEWDAVTPTEICHFLLPGQGWTHLTIAWDRAEGKTGTTSVSLNGVPSVRTPGIPSCLHLTDQDCQFQHSGLGQMYWQRRAILCGILIRSCRLAAEFSLPEETTVPFPVGDAASTGVEGTAGTFPAEEPEGIRIDALGCEPVADALPLNTRHADHIHYWHYEAAECTGGTALSCIPDGEPVRYHFVVEEPGDYWLVLRYQLVLPPADAIPRVGIEIDGQCPDNSLESFVLPATTASGTLRPEPERYKRIRVGEVPPKLDTGRHELCLTFEENSYLILDEILLTTESVPPNPPDSELLDYVRPPAMEVLSAEEQEEESVYRLRFINLAGSSLSGSLRVDDASDPGGPLRLSAERLEFTDADESVEVELSVPAEPSGRVPRRVRLVFVDDAETNRMSYMLRHRRPFRKPVRPRKIPVPNITGSPIQTPVDPEALSQRIRDIRSNPAVETLLEKSVHEVEDGAMLSPGGHAAEPIPLLIELAHLGHERDVLERLRAILLANARAVVRLLFQSPDGERRAGVRADYYNFRHPRGGLYGEMAPWEAVVYDILVAAGTLSHGDQVAIEANLFWSTYENSKRWMGGEFIYRGQVHTGVAAALLGATLDDERMLDEAEDTIYRYGKWQVLSDGGHNEKISSYGGSWIALVEMALFLREQGRPRVFDEFRDRIRLACKSFIRGCFSNGSLLRQGDGGLQRSLHVIGIERFFPLARDLFPEDPEFPEIIHYSGALRDRLQAKWNHKPPEEWPELPDEMLRKSDLFPDSGWCVLRSPAGKDRLEASLDWSATGDHGHPDKLHMNLLAFDEVLNEDLSYGWMPQTAKGQGYAMRGPSHSTVMADMRCQLPGAKGQHRLFDHYDEVQVAWAEAGSCYGPDIRADRCLILLGDKLVDLFCLTSGNSRSYDWVFHCLGEPLLPEGLRPHPPLCDPPRPGEKVSDAPGYEWFGNLKSIASAKPFSIQWHLNGYPQQGWARAEKCWLDYEMGDLHLSFPQEEPTEFFVGDAPFPVPDYDTSTRPFIMARRRARSTLFAAVFQSRSDGSPPATVESLPVLLRGRHLASHQGTALRIREFGRTITVLQRHISGLVTAGPVQETDADLVVWIQDADGSPAALHAWGATTLTIEGVRTWQSEGPQDVHQVWWSASFRDGQVSRRRGTKWSETKEGRRKT